MVEISTVGIAFLSLGVILLLVEASMPGFFVAVPATILIFLGVFALLVPEPAFFTTWAPLIVVVVGVPTTLGTIWLYQRIAPARGPPITMSADSLVDRVGVVERAVTPGTQQGKVRVAHQMWSATAEESDIPEGARVRVRRVEGVTLVVEPVSEALEEQEEEDASHG